ncbi:MAG TPA: FMN-binding negative transcriptional regulator, partial [Terriglobales bacterium]|nr:FMN-binding negative transcriptional regulator [Terriglobales bacterium]
MYNPIHFEQQDRGQMRELIARFPLGALVTTGAGGIVANHIPFEVDVETEVLRGHVARANPVWRETAGSSEVLVIFRGGDGYVSPSWYLSKQDGGGKVVPTWNYSAVHLYGTIRFVEDPSWLQSLIEQLTERHE